MKTKILLVLIGVAQLVGVCLFAEGNWLWALAVFASSHAIVLWGTLTPNSQLFGRVVTRCQDGSDLLITIDDGPDPRTTPELLRLLEQLKLKAVFFLIGERAANHPDLVLAIHEAGHTIGNHTHTHPEKRFWRIGPRAFAKEIRDCDVTIHSITGETPTLFRSPVGHSNPFVRIGVRRAGKVLVGWSARGFDGVRTPKDVVVSRLRKRIAHRAIVLLHEGYNVNERGYAPFEILQAALHVDEEGGSQ